MLRVKSLEISKRSSAVAIRGELAPMRRPMLRYHRFELLGSAKLALNRRDNVLDDLDECGQLLDNLQDD